MAENKQPNPSVWLTVKRVLGIAGGQRFWLFAALGVTLIQVALSVSFSHFMRRMFEAVSAGSHPAFWTNIWIILAITVLAGPMSYLKTLWVGLFSERTLTRIRRLIAEHSVALPVGYLEERNSGDFISVLNADLGKVKTLTASNMLDFIWNVVSFVAALTYIISVSWQLTLVSTLSTPLIFILVSA